MSNRTGVEYKQLKEMQQIIVDIIGDSESGKMYEEAMRDVGRRHLARVVQNTPFGVYEPHAVTGETRLGGTLRKGWVVDTEAEAEASKGTPSKTEINARVKTREIHRIGSSLRMYFFNRVHYAPYVDKGHRQARGRFVAAIGKRLKRTWIPGQNFIRNSENATSAEMPKVIEKHLRKALQAKLNGGKR